MKSLTYIFRLFLLLLVFNDSFANSKDCLNRIDALMQHVYDDVKLSIDEHDLYYQFYSRRIINKETSEILLINESVMRKLNAFPLPKSRTAKISLSIEEASKFHLKIKNYKVVKESMKPANENYYDPNCFIGFCFGRSMIYHLGASDNEQIHADSILKFWMVGDFANGHWNHHVVTIIRADDGGWFAFDPALDQPMKMESYFKQYKDFAGDRLVIIPTHTDRLLSSKPISRKLYFGTNEETFNYQKDDPDVFMWRSFFYDALAELEQDKF